MTHGLGVRNVHRDINMPKPRGEIQEGTVTEGSKNGKRKGYTSLVRYMVTQRHRHQKNGIWS